MSRAEVEGFTNAAPQKLQAHIEDLSSSFPDNPPARVAEEFYRLAASDPRAAALGVGEFLTRSIRVDSGSGWYAYGIGTSGWPDTIIKGLGIIYPEIDKESREAGLKDVLGYLDTVTNYFEAQDVVEEIDDPWLVADIIANRGLYWPGFKSYADALGQQRTWEDAQQTIDTAKSSFWLAYAMSRVDHTSPEVREAFQKTYSDLVDRTNDGIAAMTNASALREHERHPEISVEEAIERRLRERYDPVLHHAIREKIGEAKWILLPGNH